MDSDPSSTPPLPPSPLAWEHRSWCAPECGFRPGAVEGTHLGRAWGLPPQDGEQPGRVELRLFEQVNETETGLVRVLLSVTERRLADDLDPLAEVRGVPGPVMESGLADITSSAELTAEEAGRVFEQLVAFGKRARELGGAGRGTRTTEAVDKGAVDHRPGARRDRRSGHETSGRAGAGGAPRPSVR